MTIDLSDERYINSLKRTITPLGATTFDAIPDDTWVGYMTDAFWTARLDGFMQGFTADEDGQIDPVDGTDDLDQKYIALIVLYAAITILRNQILNMNTSFRAKAGPVEFEQQNSATMLTEILKELRAAKAQVLLEIDEIQSGYHSSNVEMLDIVSSRIFSPGAYFGSPELA